MYVTVQEASKLLGIQERTVYRYAKSGKLETKPDTKAVEIEIESIYRLREEIKNNGLHN